MNHRLSLLSTNGFSQKSNLYVDYERRVADMSANFSHLQLFLFQNGKQKTQTLLCLPKNNQYHETSGVQGSFVFREKFHRHT